MDNDPAELGFRADGGKAGPDSGAKPRVTARGRARRLAYGLALFLTSAGGLILEIVAGRMIAPYVGMSLYTWTAVIAVVLTGFSLGHWVGGRLAEVEHRSGCWRLCWILLLAAISTGACLPLIRLVSPLVVGELHPITTIVLLTSALFLLPSLFVGAVSPILTKLAVDALPQAPGRVIGQMFATGAVGSIAGTLTAGYLMISWIGSIGSVLTVAAAYLITALVFGWAARPAVARAVAATALAAVAGLAVALLGIRVQAYTSPCLVESDYYCIQVVDFSFETGRPSAVMVLDHLGHGINDREDPTRLHSSYLVLTDHLLSRRLGPPHDFAAFFIGGGANTLPRAWAATYPEARLVVSEVDPSVTRVARDAMWFEPGGNVTIDHRDARVALRAPPDKGSYDVIVGDAFHDISVPQHLTTLEFARLLRDRLTTSGFYALNVIDSGRQPLFLFATVKTLGAVFKHVEVWMDEAMLTGGGRMTYLVVAGDRSTGQSTLQSSTSDASRWRRWPTADLARRIESAGVPLLTDDFAPVDRLMLPVLSEDP